MSILDILVELEQTPSRNQKICILQREENNELLKRVIKLALDPFIQFYQRKIPKYTLNEESSVSLSVALDSLSVLSERNKTGNAAIKFLSDLMSSAERQKDAIVLERIIAKDLKCGVADGTVNKVWPGLIPSFPVMLCSKYDEKSIQHIQYPAFAQIKMDGMRVAAIVKDGKVEYRSRNGKPLDFFGTLDDEFLALANGQDLVFDGELLVVDENGVINRQTGNGILSKANKGTITKVEAQKIRAVLWDVIPYESFLKGQDETLYHDRWSDLVYRLDTTSPKNILRVESEIVDSFDDANVLFQKALERGEEGIILKNVNSPWEDKRSKNLVKFKSEKTCDLRVVAVAEGTGKNEGKIGALALESEDGILKVSVGSGLVDSDREWLPEKWLGKILEIKYNCRIQNKAGEESLFLPIFLRIRDDKNVANTIGEIE